MPFETAAAQLKSRGFTTAGRCAFTLRNSEMQRLKLVRIGTGTHPRQGSECDGGGRLTWFSVRYTIQGVGGSETMIDLVKDAERRLGARPTCRMKSETALQRCIFQRPPAARDLEQVILHGGLGNRALDMTLELVARP